MHFETNIWHTLFMERALACRFDFDDNFINQFIHISCILDMSDHTHPECARIFTTFKTDVFLLMIIIL